MVGQLVVQFQGHAETFYFCRVVVAAVEPDRVTLIVVVQLVAALVENIGAEQRRGIAALVLVLVQQQGS